MIKSRDMHHFHRSNYLVVAAAAVDEDDAGNEVITLMLRTRNASGSNGESRKYQVPLETELGRDLLEMIRMEQGR